MIGLKMLAPQQDDYTDHSMRPKEISTLHEYNSTHVIS